MAATDRTGKSPAFQFYPDAFLSSTKVQRMSMTERGIYITLLANCWLDGSLPNDLRKIAGMVQMKPTQFERIWSNVLNECFAVKGERLVNDRLERERLKQKTFRQKAKAAADKGWQGRRNADPMPTHSEPTADPMHSVSISISNSVSKNKGLTTTTRGAPIHPKRNLHAAWEGSRGLYVVQGQHQKFLALSNHPSGEVALFAWYGEVAREWTDGARKHDNPGTDMVKFWDARHAERWPVSQPVNGKVAPGDAWRPEGQ